MIVRALLCSLLVLAIVSAAGCLTSQHPVAPVTTAPVSPAVTAPTPMNGTGCMVDGDCVPAECCHPAGCINRVAQKSCESAICTASCQGPLDCGAGSCGCVQGTCTIVPARDASVAGRNVPALQLAATPQRYSPLMSSTPGIALTVNRTGFDPATTNVTWSATYGRFLTWNPPDYTVTEQGAELSNHGEKIYWSFYEKPASNTTPVILSVVARNAASGTELGRSTVTLVWDGDLAVRVAEIR